MRGYGIWTLKLYMGDLQCLLLPFNRVSLLPSRWVSTILKFIYVFWKGHKIRQKLPFLHYLQPPFYKLTFWIEGQKIWEGVPTRPPTYPLPICLHKGTHSKLPAVVMSKKGVYFRQICLAFSSKPELYFFMHKSVKVFMKIGIE